MGSPNLALSWAGEDLSVCLDRLDEASLVMMGETVFNRHPELAVEALLLERPDLPVVLMTAAEHKTRLDSLREEGVYDIIADDDATWDGLPWIFEKCLAIAEAKQENVRLHKQVATLLGQVKAKNNELADVNQRLEAIAATDALTGLANRRSFLGSLTRRFAQAQRETGDLSVLMIDLDGFKAVNDKIGHHAGDRLLELTAEVLSVSARKSDVVARLGGDEFVVLFPDTNEATACEIAQRLRPAFAQAIRLLSQELGYDGPVSMSLGLTSLIGAQAMTPDQLLTHADQAMYHAKHNGKDDLAIYRAGAGVMLQRELERASDESGLDAA